MLQKSLKIPKGLSEDEIKEGHTIQWAKEKWQKGQTIIKPHTCTSHTACICKFKLIYSENNDSYLVIVNFLPLSF
jgi:hypothetical protein